MTDSDPTWSHCEGKNVHIWCKIKKNGYKFCLKSTLLTHAYEVQSFIVSELL